MTTLAEFRARCRIAIADVNGVEWSDGVVDNWIREGIADYSAHFFYRRSVDVSMVSGKRDYVLPVDALLVLSVEYPAYQIPPVFLQYSDWLEGDSFDGVGEYCFLRDVAGGGVLWLGFDPDPLAVCRVRYECSHDSVLAAGDAAVLTVPDDHLLAVELYVKWAAIRNLQSQEELNPTNANTLLMSQYATNSYRAERAYSSELRRLLFSANVDSGYTPWRIPDGVGRIY